MKLPSMSKLDLVFSCPAAGVLPAEQVVSEASERGTALHEFLAKSVTVAAQPSKYPWTHQQLLDEVPAEYRQDADAIDVQAALPPLDWHRRVYVELAFALDPIKHTARILGENIGRDEAYKDLQEGEIPGTADVVGWLPDGTLYVGDFKTGNAHHVKPAADNWQLKALACAAALSLGIQHDAGVKVAIIRTQGEVRHDETELDALDLDVALGELAGLVDRLTINARSDRPFTRQGSHCNYCPSFMACPAKVGLVRRLLNDPKEVVNETTKLALTDVGYAYQRYRDIKTVTRKLDTAFAMLAEKGNIPTGKGTYYGYRERQETEIDARAAMEVIYREFGQDAAKDAVNFSTSKAQLERVVKAHVPRGQGSKALKKVMDAVAEAGGVQTKTKKVLGEHKLGDENDGTS